MEEAAACRQDDFMCFAEDLLTRWERRQAASAVARDHELEIPAERECLPCLLEDEE